MISSIASMIWTSVPVMYSIFTMVFLIGIRLWTRSDAPSKIKKVAEKLGHEAEKIKSEAFEAGKGVVEDISETKLPCSKTVDLDPQFYGELFIAGLVAGTVVKAGWS